ncbi:hypothetical protein INS49_009346 [Diaporthe citri]|uniref:uncharacterized protein n=1 Tax=Diaporthe citri TaxID=83186 RepID=UPI001C804A61|nr:uncharacterized protein INS49_009346 [Diaporthe citri]KAG6361122.1 hypothetical protein INS49_009346 [Diaporthe citri]
MRETTSPVCVSNFPRPMETPEAEPEWAQRVLKDSTAFSEPADPARTDIVFGSRTFRSEAHYISLPRSDPLRFDASLWAALTSLRDHKRRERRTPRVNPTTGAKWWCRVTLALFMINGRSQWPVSYHGRASLPQSLRLKERLVV